MKDLKKLMTITTVFISLNLKVQGRMSKKKRVRKKMVQNYFFKKRDTIQGKPTLLAVFKLL